MKAAILTIGDEILIGQTVNTNAAYIGTELHKIGLDVERVLTIKDQAQEIKDAVDELFRVADMLIVTGGLGPTNDDITKETLTVYFEDELVMNEDVLGRIKNRFEHSGHQFLDVHKQQALLPSKARLLKNTLGTASGMWFQKENKHLISIPGVPYEMQKLMDELVPELQSSFELDSYYQRTIHFQGIVESQLAEENRELEVRLRAAGIGMAFLPSPGLVRIRLSGTPDQRAEIDSGISEMEAKYPKHCFGLDQDSLESSIGDLLRSRKETLSTVESCTSGLLAGRICSVAGASDYFIGSIISYDNRIKIEQLGVSRIDLEEQGAVSRKVVEAMALNGREKLNTNYCIATSGIAGPGGGTKDKPVGTIWIAVAAENEVYSRLFHFRHNRGRNIESTVVFAINYLRRVILGFEAPS